MPSNDAMASREESSSARRKSINFLSRVGLPNLNTNIGNDQEDAEKKDKKKSSKRNSIFALGPPTNTNFGRESPINSDEKPISSTKIQSRPRTLQKGRPSSIFGSLGRRSINETEPESIAGSPITPPSEKEGRLSSTMFSRTVLYHGEVQTTSGMFRKKKEYLVLTDTHLCRMKSQLRAAETFPSIKSNGGRSSNTRHPSTTSIGSLHEVQSTTSHASSEHETRIPLGQIVTAYKVEDGRPFFTTDVVHLDEECHGVGSLQLILHDPKEADLWLTSIRGAAEKARLLMPVPFPDRIIRYLASALEDVSDYSTDHFQVYRVVRRVSTPVKNKSSSDDLQKLGSSVYYMVIGINRIHFVPLPEFNTKGNLVAPKSNRMTHGVVALVDLRVVNDDDRFELVFRTPLQSADALELAASATQDIAISIVRSWQYLKPLWEDFNFNFSCPRRLIQICEAQAPPIDEEMGCLDRTLVAYCLAYKCNPENIQYAVDFEVEDGPEFVLWPPRYTKVYKLTELLAVMRALRYNESFMSVSFRDVDLHSLHGWIESNGTEHVESTTRGGTSLQKYFTIDTKRKSVLYQEIQALALKSVRLRRFDFTNTLPRRRPKDTFDIEGGDIDKDPGCEVVAALLPLIQKQLTNVDWIILNGIELGETDLDFLIPALNNVDSRMRAIETARCGLNDRGIMVIITHLARQNASLECVNLSDNPGRIQLEQFQGFVSRFTRLRKLDLSKTVWTQGDTSMFLPEVMRLWPLQELMLNAVMINQKTLDVLGAYLASDASTHLGILRMDQCYLTGNQVAQLMYDMTGNMAEARRLEFHVSGNRLEKGVSEIISAIEKDRAPECLYLQMWEFTKEDHFRQLLEALRKNTTIRVLDISKASLPTDANEETCEALRKLFADNDILEELDISGEQAHLEVTRFGVGLCHALTGLKENSSLKILRIEYQNLGLEGANTLASVIEANSGLTHIYCERNNINFQGFTTIVNALAKNYSLLVLPFCKDDQAVSMKRMNADIRDNGRAAKSGSKKNNMGVSVRRKLNAFGSKSSKQPDVTPQDLDEAVRTLNEYWHKEADRLAQFLDRNSKIAAGVPGWTYEENMLSEVTLRPTTALSDHGILEQVMSNTTPRGEIRNPVDEYHIADISEVVTPRIEITNPVDGYVINTQNGSTNPTAGRIMRDGQENLSQIHGNSIQRSYSPTGAPQLNFPLAPNNELGSDKFFEAGENGMFMMDS